MRKTLTAALLTASLLTLAARGEDEDGSAEAAHNDADVMFAQQMIPHHEQAIEMAELAETRAASQEVKDLAGDIETAQDPEIETMTGWLGAWGEDMPGQGEHGGRHDTTDMPGMIDEEAMSDLEAATGEEFDRLFLTSMIEHHEGALDMARAEQEDGEYPDAIALAEDIEAAQRAEIATMKELLAS
jgi:uncharacterized protein (DUF305 family)